MSCEYCEDSNGISIYPYYGLAPHSHSVDPISPSGLSTRFLSPPDAPANFSPDNMSGGQLGTYTHCLLCGQPEDRD